WAREGDVKMIAARDGRIWRRSIIRDPFSKRIFLAPKFSGVGLFGRKLRAHLTTNGHEFKKRPLPHSFSDSCPFVFNSWLIYLGWPKKRRVEDRPEMDNPAQQHKPENCG